MSTYRTNPFPKSLLKKNIYQIKKGGIPVIIKKIITLLRIFSYLPMYLLSIPILILLKLISFKYLIRFKKLESSRIGHFGGNTELYLCERDISINEKKIKYIDLFYARDVCNKQLFKMWKRDLKILPSWILLPLHQMAIFLKIFFSSFDLHLISEKKDDRDIFNLFDKTKPHLKFTSEEEIYGKECMKKFGLADDSKFVCLCVRDSAYLKQEFNDLDFSYHDYRDGNIENYLLAAEELTKKGYFVFRMGKKVIKPLKSSNPKIIDYANSEMRSDFMDIYLGAKCTFCISTGVGIDIIPIIFRKPLVEIEAPVAFLRTYCKNFLLLTKHHVLANNNQKLRLSEIVSSEIVRGLTTESFKSKGIKLVENSPEEIRDVALEMADRLEGTWIPDENDEKLQDKFWKIFTSESKTQFSAYGTVLHGEIRARYGAKFLRENINWLN